MFIAFNSTFAPLFALGFLGQPRRVVTYPRTCSSSTTGSSVSAFVLGASMLVFLFNLVYSLRLRARAGARESVGLALARVAAALAGAGAQLRSDPRHHRRPVRLRPARRTGCRSTPAPAGGVT